MSKNKMRSKNLVLAALQDDEYDRVSAKLAKVQLPLGKVLYQSGAVMKYVYFPESGLVSLVKHMKEKVTVEVGVIGKDGMVGIPIVFGDNVAFEEAIVQMEGSARRMSTHSLKAEMTRGKNSLQVQLFLYARYLMKQVTQTAACNSQHTIEQRLSRWMLMCRDRMEGDELPLTQEFISNMLGTRREGVSIAASILQREGLIKYSRGKITILNKDGLEAFSCECYDALKAPNRRRTKRVIDHNT